VSLKIIHVTQSTDLVMRSELVMWPVQLIMLDWLKAK